MPLQLYNLQHVQICFFLCLYTWIRKIKEADYTIKEAGVDYTINEALYIGI